MSSDSSDTTSSGTDSSAEGPDMGISDDQLPEDLQPGEDNPLASPADEDVPEDLLAEEAGHDHSGQGQPDDPAGSSAGSAGSSSG